MARQFSLRSGCKINIYLKILKKRNDGYHDIDSIFLPLANPWDQVEIIENSQPGLRLKCCPPELENRQNILHKAYAAFAQATGFRPGLTVFLHKKIPTGAGLGGGSSNAAMILLALNKMAGARGLDLKDILRLAAGVGADVPFFIKNHPARVQGIGEVLTPVKTDLNGLKMILICPGLHVDTAWAYSQWDIHQKNPVSAGSDSLTSLPTTDKASRLEEQPVFSNSFEEIVFKAFPEIRKIKLAMLESGAGACVMSGSGSSLTAWFRDQDRAFNACCLLDSRSIPFYYYNL
ncbi:4-(cytidine 5'-diphospho)-2-C-methyl-D-erythritol kinase [Desulfonatronovibrio hydrogenovorans]|uniref:4-(cytidine 5'-diphospho)-2-C-methyl-D-erythritol kinase n=1 Tax=Desulfonatronovibrio hydrogenovorans TaxID=53245 RepID=UPI00048AE14F|nr:4-(cytidine 5'-diphospho)-2-C-methyl-D-erythritol kinase [Desulfonatronovibrio hydrogenovorans]